MGRIWELRAGAGFGPALKPPTRRNLPWAAAVLRPVATPGRGGGLMPPRDPGPAVSRPTSSRDPGPGGRCPASGGDPGPWGEWGFAPPATPGLGVSRASSGGSAGVGSAEKAGHGGDPRKRPGDQLVSRGIGMDVEG